MFDTIVMLATRFLVYSLFIILYSLFFIQRSSAQDSPEFSLGIFPPVIEITADPPAQPETQITIQNLSENEQDLSMEFKSFRLSLEGNGRIEHLSTPLIREMLKVYDDKGVPIEGLKLAPFEEKQLTLKIDIERGAPRGDYYFSIIFLSKNESQTDQSTIQSSGGIGTNIILSIGKIGPTKGEIIKYEAPLFVMGGPVPFTLLIRNNSDHYITPRGRITIKNVLGQDVGRIDLKSAYILSNSERYMESLDATASARVADNQLSWGERFLLGIYTARASIKLSDNGPEFDKTITFFAIPIYMLFATSFFTFILLGIYLRVKRKI